ncbi:hypothetical protein ACW9I8_02365, partial [Pseudomonas reactans]
FNNFNHLRFRSLVSGRRILQHYTLLSTPLFQLPFGFDELKQSSGETYITHCLPRSFRFDCAGSGANYRLLESAVNR